MTFLYEYGHHFHDQVFVPPADKQVKQPGLCQHGRDKQGKFSRWNRQLATCLLREIMVQHLLKLEPPESAVKLEQQLVQPGNLCLAQLLLNVDSRVHFKDCQQEVLDRLVLCPRSDQVVLPEPALVGVGPVVEEPSSDDTVCLVPVDDKLVLCPLVSSSPFGFLASLFFISNRLGVLAAGTVSSVVV